MYNRTGCGGGAELYAVISIAIIPALPTHLDPSSCCCAQLSICYLTQHTHTKVQPIPAYTLLLSLSELQFHIYSGTPVRYYNHRVIHRWMKGIQLFFPLAYEKSELLSSQDIYPYTYTMLFLILKSIHPPALRLGFFP
jgi:hypothetical protein